jgi:hypothetical protein
MKRGFFAAETASNRLGGGIPIDRNPWHGECFL